ncbi:putative truncated het-r protein [Botrytis fragariae]|uniref:Putative truncated het-r protein n=1 Tax=Botrytis fragariae TaxID=1964551 RepID=A0A8H6AT84_9HELO|nr:putative truncated het-r protein [Botrytis fragariae]KAF5873177.1 putative truncated het-r protein [Botrytis fragariae]
MRLLHYNSDGHLSWPEFFESEIPEYAILSHRWGTEEVTFEDLLDGTSKSKAGYSKIKFCGEQARRNGLQYFWVDTCCINRSNSTELAEAINSMFRWYKNATRCYVYLSDVPRPCSYSTEDSIRVWEPTFRKSEWFTRGWTLQELIAPGSVEFFSNEGEILGDKISLERCICEITGVPINVLRGSELSDFSFAERMSWAESRVTFREEDKAYSLFGILKVYLPPIYGEGKHNALRRLQEEFDKTVREKLFVPDPRFAGRRNVGQENVPWLGIGRRLTGFGNSGTFRGSSGLKCFRCDNCHRLDDCFASLDTVFKARDRRMKSNRCFNCGSEWHWAKECDWEDLQYQK